MVDAERFSGVYTCHVSCARARRHKTPLDVPSKIGIFCRGLFKFRDELPGRDQSVTSWYLVEVDPWAAR